MTDAVWTLSETFQGQLKPVSFELLAWGRQLADDLNVDLVAIVLGDISSPEDLSLLIQHGADKIRVVSEKAFHDFRVRPFAYTLKHLVEQYQPQIFLAAATTTGRTVMPYLSMLVEGGLTADCTGLEIDPETHLLLQTRPAIGGNIMATIKTPTARPQMATVRPKSKKPLPIDSTRTGEIIREEIPDDVTECKVEQLEFLLNEEQGSIETAETIVAGGRAMKSIENFVLLQQLAEKLNGTIAASRVPVDYGWQPYPKQVGLSGKTISPRLYIACGISGAIQHLAGIQTAENIIAINKDPDAQIFQVANFGIVGDLFEILPIILEQAPGEKEGEL